MDNTVTEKQQVLIQKVEIILDEKFEGETRQDAFQWLRKWVPEAEEKLLFMLETIGKLKNLPQAKDIKVQNMMNSRMDGFSARMKKLLELDRQLKSQPDDTEVIENIIRELKHVL